MMGEQRIMIDIIYEVWIHFSKYITRYILLELEVEYIIYNKWIYFGVKLYCNDII